MPTSTSLLEIYTFQGTCTILKISIRFGRRPHLLRFRFLWGPTRLRLWRVHCRGSLHFAAFRELLCLVLLFVYLHFENRVFQNGIENFKRSVWQSIVNSFWMTIDLPFCSIDLHCEGIFSLRWDAWEGAVKKVTKNFCNARNIYYWLRC